ncbi:MAG: hypothetical protein PHS84_12925 [Paludibacter sp.]|jgi:hypothetical protein|nr:hypothetical protein [Paludibacter sp.]
MNTNISEWVSEKRKQLDEVTHSYPIAAKVKFRLSYLNNLLLKINDLKLDEDDILLTDLENIINLLPPKAEEMIFSDYQSKLNDLIFMVKQRFNLTSDNYYRKDLNPLTIKNLIGISLGSVLIYISIILFNKTALSIEIGILLIIVLSHVTGILLDRKAQKENRVL